MAIGSVLGGVKSDNTLWIWGHNGNGNLGLNLPDNSHRSSPTQVPGVWTQVEKEIYKGTETKPVVFTTR